MLIKELWVEGISEDKLNWVPVEVISLFKSTSTTMDGAGNSFVSEQMHALYYDPRNGEINQELLSETFIKTLFKDEKGRESVNFSAPPRKEDWGETDRKHNSADNSEA